MTMSDFDLLLKKGFYENVYDWYHLRNMISIEEKESVRLNIKSIFEKFDKDKKSIAVGLLSHDYKVFVYSNKIIIKKLQKIGLDPIPGNAPDEEDRMEFVS